VLDRIMTMAKSCKKSESELEYMLVSKCRTVVTCIDGMHISEKVERQYSMNVHIDGFSSLLDAIIASALPCRVTDYKRSHTDSHQTADIQAVCSVLPAVLQVNLQRFSYCASNGITKYNGRLTFKEKLDLTSYSKATARSVYRLQSVVVHSGTANAGHYYVFIRPTCHGDEWFRCDNTRVTRVDRKAAMDNNFGETGLSTNAYVLVYIRECDLQSHVWSPRPSQAMPSTMRDQFVAEEAEELTRSSMMSVKYCTSDDLMLVSDIGLLPADHKFKSVIVQVYSTIGALRDQFATRLECTRSNVLVMGYLPAFTCCYEDDFQTLDTIVPRKRQRSQEEDSGMVMCVCRRDRICNAQGRVDRVVVIKRFSAVDSQLTVLGLAQLYTNMYAEVYDRVRDLMLDKDDPFVMFMEPDNGTGSPVQLKTSGRLCLTAGSVIVAEMTSSAPGFMQCYHEMRNRCSLELRHAAAPGEDVRPDCIIKCSPATPYKQVVIELRTRLQIKHVRIMKNNAKTNAAVPSLDDFPEDVPVSSLYTQNRSHAQRYILHYEVLTCDASDLKRLARVVALVCAGDVRAQSCNMLPREWTAAQICSFYAEQHPALQSLQLRVLIVKSHFLVGVMRDELVEQVALQRIRVEAVPPAPDCKESDFAVVPVHM
jgi:hypothetical protein